MIQFLLTPPAMLPEARALGRPLIHPAFQLSPQGGLLREPLPPDHGGGLMAVGTRQAPGEGRDPRRALEAILQLCDRQGFAGVLLDSEGPPTPYLSGLIRGLEGALSRRGRLFLLPEPYGRLAPRALLCLSSALSGGSLRRRLETAAAAWGRERLVLGIRRMAEDFPLPAPQGAGQPLSSQELREKLRRLEPRVSFSPALCAYCFTYLDRAGGARFVLFDRRESLEKKRVLAEELGIPRVIWCYPEVREELPGLLGEA